MACLFSVCFCELNYTLSQEGAGGLTVTFGHADGWQFKLKSHPNRNKETSSLRTADLFMLSIS